MGKPTLETGGGGGLLAALSVVAPEKGAAHGGAKWPQSFG